MTAIPIGRETVIIDILHSVLSNKKKMILVSGPPGVGKSDVLLSIRDSLRSDGALEELSKIKEGVTAKDIPFMSCVSVKRLLGREGIVIADIISELKKSVNKRRVWIKRFLGGFFDYVSGISIGAGPIGIGVSFTDGDGEANPWEILKKAKEKADDTGILMLLRDIDDISKHSYVSDQDRQNMQAFVHGLRNLLDSEPGKLIIVATLDFVRTETLAPLLERDLSETYELGPLEERRYVRELVKHEGIEAGDQTLENIIQISGGFPDCIKTICKGLKRRRLFKVSGEIPRRLLERLAEDSWRDVYRQLDEHEELHRITILLGELNGSATASQIASKGKMKALLDNSYKELTKADRVGAYLNVLTESGLTTKIDDLYELRYVIRD